MTERTIYTCDNCGHESSDRKDFLNVTLSRERTESELMGLTYYPHVMYATLAKNLFCKKCCETVLGVDFTFVTPRPRISDNFVLLRAIGRMITGKSCARDDEKD